MKKLERIIKRIFLFLLRISILERNFQPSEIDHSSIKKILVVLRHQMGDMLCATPMLRCLKNFYHESEITLVTKSSTRWSELFREGNLADKVKYYENGFENLIGLLKELQEEKFDLAVIPSTVTFSATNHIIAHFSKAGIKAGVASINNRDNPAAFILNVKNHFMWESQHTHQIERNLDIIRQLNISVSESRIRINLNDSDINFAKKYLSENCSSERKLLIGFHPGAAKEDNVWSAENFAELANRLNDKFGINLIISEGPSDEKYVSKLTDLLSKNYPQVNFINLKEGLSKDLSVLSHLDLFISNDTGIMHAVSGFDKSLIALFGPTKASEWGAIGENKVSIQSPNENIGRISVDTVYEACLMLLAKV